MENTKGLSFREMTDAMTPIALVWGVTSAAALLAQSSYSSSVRGAAVVGPFFEHSGNTHWSAPFAMAALGIAAASERVVGSPNRLKRIMTASIAGLAIGFTANAASDTTTGYELTHHMAADDPQNGSRFNTIDSGDLIWGTASTVVLAAVAGARRDTMLERTNQPIATATEPPRLPETTA